MSQRYQREIEEILQQVNEKGGGGKGPAEPGTGKLRPSSRRPRGGDGRSVLGFIRIPSPGRLFFAGLALLVAALVLRTAVPGVSGPMVWVGVGLFIAAYIMFFTRARRPSERRWRGRTIDDEFQPGLLERLWTWLRGR